MYSFSLYRLLTILLLLFVVVLLLLVAVVVGVLGLRFGFENNDVLPDGVDKSNGDVDDGECETGVANISAPDDDDDDDIWSSLALYCECNANTVLLSISSPIT